MSASNELRALLIRFCSSKRTRTSKFSKGSPCDWNPLNITDPRTGQAFTDDGAWDFVVEHLRGGVELTPMTLDKPPGKKAWYFTAAGYGRAIIYIKLQPLGDSVLGRSFHLSEHN